MAKTLKLSTIEKRFKKLHDVANFAEDYAKAIAAHVQLLLREDQVSSLADATLSLVEQIDAWTEKFAPLASEMQRVETLYYANVNGDSAELIEAVPSTAGYPTEEPYKLTEQLCRIGYIEIEGDPYRTADKNYTDAEIVTNVENLYHSLALCVKALANASYTGIWEEAGKMAIEIYENFPNKAIITFLRAYTPE